MGRFSYAEQNGGQNASGHIVIISIGSILGAGLFCGLTVIYDMIGIHMVPLIILTGILAGIVSLFLMEMNLAGPPDWNYAQIMLDIYGPAAGHFAVSAYIGAMVVGPASEIIAARMILCEIFEWLPLFPVCLMLSIVIFAIDSMFGKHEIFNFYTAFFKILAIMVFCFIGLFAVCHLFKGVFYTTEVPWPINFSGLARGSIASSACAIYGSIMIYGGIESIGFLLYNTKKSSEKIATETLKIVFRAIVINVISVPILAGIMTIGTESDVSIFIRALKLIGCNPIIVECFRVIIFLSGSALTITSMLPTTQMLKNQLINVQNSTRHGDTSIENRKKMINWFIRGLLLLCVVQTAWLGEAVYKYLFFFSGFCFCVMWSMIAVSCSKFCDKYGDGSEWRVPGEKILRILTLAVLIFCFIESITTKIGQITVLMSLVWFIISLIGYRRFLR